MKIKLSKIMAAVTALGVTFAGFSAMAATITTTTSYDYTNDAAATVSVETVVSGVNENDEITYYVHNSAISANEGILYIDQQTVPTDATSVTFNFSGVKQGDLYASTTVAKNGADITGWTVTPFRFNEGANYISNAPAEVKFAGDAETISGTAFEDSDTNEAGYTFTGKVIGNPVKYGVRIGDEYYQALGCDADGNFTIALVGNGVTDTFKDAVAYPWVATE